MIEKRAIAVNREEHEANARQEALRAEMGQARKRSLQVERRELRRLNNKMRRKPATNQGKRKDQR
jgi:hypothetical protein